LKVIADWLGVSVMAVGDVPLWWIDKAAIVLEAEHEVREEHERKARANSQ
jgi:hypothetical protein